MTMRTAKRAAAAVVSFAMVASAFPVFLTPATAAADVCGSVGGRRVSVGGCADLADAIAPYVPPPGYYAPMPEDVPPPPPPPPRPNVTVCANVGRRINVSACT
jgi:hypothetical protein